MKLISASLAGLPNRNLLVSQYYKTGKSNHVGRRQYQIALQLPEPVNTLHSIATDDPDGIEIYWHNRFKNKRAEGEWFSLSQDDIRAFKARRFM